MAHKKLTKGDRIQLTDHMVGKAIKESITALRTKEQKLFMAVRDFRLGKHKKAFDTLPEAFVNTECWVKVNIQGDGHAIQRGIYNYTEPDDSHGYTNVTFPPTGSWYGVAINPTSTKKAERELAMQLIAHHDLMVEHDTKETKLRTSISVTLNACSTTKRLKEEWPEGYKEYVSIFGDPETSGKVTLPMVPTAKVNAMLKDFPDSVEVA